MALVMVERVVDQEIGQEWVAIQEKAVAQATPEVVDQEAVVLVQLVLVESFGL
jgi:hypothetical protein